MLEVHDVLMYDIIVCENPRFRPSTRKGEAGVIKKSLLWKHTFSMTVFIG